MIEPKAVHVQTDKEQEEARKPLLDGLQAYYTFVDGGVIEQHRDNGFRRVFKPHQEQ